MYDIQSIYEAETIEDAIVALDKDKDAIIINGGSDVLIQIREGRHAGSSLVSIHNIDELKGITIDEDGTISIGAGTTFSHITNHGLIQKHVPILGGAVDQVGGPQVRNTGTIGGNICNGVTSADSAPSLLILNAMLELAGIKGQRIVSIHDFYAGPGKTIREQGEILKRILIRKEDYENFYGQYTKYGKRNAMEIATLGCAVGVKLSTDKEKLKEVRIAFGVAAPIPIRCNETEKKVAGLSLSKEIEEIMAASVLKEVSPRTSWRASKEFRLQLIEELTRRTFRKAVVLAGGEAYV